MLAIISTILSVAFSPALVHVDRPALLPRRVASPTTMRSIATSGASNAGQLPAFDNGAPLGVVEKDASVVFGMLDEDGDGEITRSEMSSRLSDCGYTEARIELVFGKMDLNADDVISEYEFQQAYINYPTLRTAPCLGGGLKAQLEEDADALFQVLDADGNGTVSEAELRTHLQSYGYEPEFASKIMSSLDFDQSGEIDRDELSKAFVIHPSMRTAPGLGGGR